MAAVTTGDPAAIAANHDLVASPNALIGIPLSLRTFIHRLLPVIGLVLFILAVWVIYRQMHSYRWADIVAAFGIIPWPNIAMAILFTIVGYTILTGYDYLAMYYVNHAIKYRRVALAAFIGYAFSNSIGHSFLTGGGVRYRLYTIWGVSGVNIAKVIAFGHVAFYLGMLVLIGQGCLLEPGPVSDEVHLPKMVVQIIGAVMLVLVLWYFIWTVRRRKPLSLKWLDFPMPSLRLSLAQLVIATLDMALVAAVLYVLLPGDVGVSFVGFVGLFMIAQVIGVSSQVPGGLGVFETIMLHVLTPHIPAPQVLASLVVYRIIYFLAPLIIATILLFGYEIIIQHRSLRKARADARLIIHSRRKTVEDSHRA